MGLGDILKGTGKLITGIFTKFFSWDFLFGISLSWVEKLFRFYGFIAFTITILAALKVALGTGTDFASIAVIFVLELVRSIIAVDQNIYNLTVQYNAMPSPSLYESILNFLLVAKESFFYLWWWRCFKWIIKNFRWTIPVKVVAKLVGMRDDDVNQDIQEANLNWWSFKILYVWLIITNVVYMIFISRQIIFPFVEITGFMTVLQNIYIAADTFFSNWWHFLVAFKGIGYYLLSGTLLKLYAQFTGGTVLNATNTT